MTPTVRQVAAAPVEQLFAAGAAAGALSDRLGEQAELLVGARRSSGAVWEGRVALLAALDLGGRHLRLEAARDELRSLATLLGLAAEELVPVRTAARAALSAADPAANPAAGPAAARAACAAALDAAQAADRRTADRLSPATREARDGSALDPATARTALDRATALAAARLPPAGSSPRQVHDWWEGLDAGERQLLVQEQPALVGSLDGVPCAARDLANRRLLDRLIDDAEDSGRRDGLLAVRDRLERGPTAGGPLLLLAIGTEGQGRAVLSFGDPDSADHISAYVPGMGTRVADVAGKDADRALAVRQAAGSRAASVVWLGYDPPLAARDALSDGRAAAGAAGYNRFLAGLRASHDGRPPHITALGHSYGSLLVGRAAARAAGADEVVLVGSPGTGVGHASDLQVPPGHVWVGAAPDDPVARLPSRRRVAGSLLGSLPGVLPTVLRLTDPGRETWFGRNPVDPGFGARRFPVDDGPDTGGMASAHSHYLDPGSRSLAAVARIVTGSAGAPVSAAESPVRAIALDHPQAKE